MAFDIHSTSNLIADIPDSLSFLYDPQAKVQTGKPARVKPPHLHLSQLRGRWSFHHSEMRSPVSPLWGGGQVSWLSTASCRSSPPCGFLSVRYTPGKTEINLHRAGYRSVYS